jgi:hypothetical protein
MLDLQACNPEIVILCGFRMCLPEDDRLVRLPAMQKTGFPGSGALRRLPVRALARRPRARGKAAGRFAARSFRPGLLRQPLPSTAWRRSQKSIHNLR